MRIKWLSAGALAISAITAIAAIADDKPATGEAIIPPTAAQSLPPAAPPPPATAVATTPAPTAPAPQGTATASTAQSTPKFGQEQLDQLLAPVALYPDQLLGQILMASTYPLEVVEAARWVREPAHRALHGDALFAAMKDQGWDPSVMALVPFDRVLQVMNDRLDWMRDLGAAFVAQQPAVMAEVQRLRHLAMAAGNLKQTAACHCVIGTQGETITITAAEPGPICLPAYNARVAYGRWPYPDYPPAAFPVPVGVAWAPGVLIGYYPVVDLAWAGPLWGWDRIDWAANSIVVDPGRYAFLASRDPGFSGGVWRFDPTRHGAVTALGVAAASLAVRGHGVAAEGAVTGPTVFRGGARAFGRAAPAFAARATASHFAGRGRFGGMAPFARYGAAGHFGGHFGGMHQGGFGGGGAHIGGPASFGLGGGGHRGGGAFHGGGGAFHGGGGHHR